MEVRMTVMMANYNNSAYIKEAIESVINQTFSSWELLIVDDKSKDDSLNIIEKFTSDNRIKLFKNNKNKGYIYSLKKLIKLSSSDVLCILDSDDALMPEALETMFEAHKHNQQYGFIYSNYMICDEYMHAKHIGNCGKIPEGISNITCDCVSHFRTYKKSAYLKTDGYDESILYAEDKDITFKLEEVTKLLFVDEILYKYRVVSNSQSHDPVKAQIGLASFVLAKYKAYNRRINTDSPSIPKNEILGLLLKLGEELMNTGLYRIARRLLLRAILLDPTNVSTIRKYIGSFVKNRGQP